MDRRSSVAFALATGLALLVHAVLARAATPDWVEGNGTASAYPAGRFLVGFAQTTGKTETTARSRPRLDGGLPRGSRARRHRFSRGTAASLLLRNDAVRKAYRSAHALPPGCRRQKFLRDRAVA